MENIGEGQSGKLLCDPRSLITFDWSLALFRPPRGGSEWSRMAESKFNPAHRIGDRWELRRVPPRPESVPTSAEQPAQLSYCPPAQLREPGFRNCPIRNYVDGADQRAPPAQRESSRFNVYINPDHQDVLCLLQATHPDSRDKFLYVRCTT